MLQVEKRHEVMQLVNAGFDSIQAYETLLSRCESGEAFLDLLSEYCRIMLVEEGRPLEYRAFVLRSSKVLLRLFGTASLRNILADKILDGEQVSLHIKQIEGTGPSFIFSY